ncbi:conserved hypothetical protein [Trichinella spiralis]|uniref:hypothetical protein n=1 Tax=Trichinella spiralis TaxID=6334 RepID=UPI0001EFC097|nr:conserved hypothetical protein [Trichinella spiralis]
MDWQGLGSVHFRISEGEQIATIKATARGQAISCFCTAQLCSACPPENFRMLPFPWGRYNFLSYNYTKLMEMATLSLMLVHAFLCYLLVVQSGATKFRRSPCAYGDDLQMKNLQNCLESVRNKAADASIYWFGDRMKAACSGSILHNSPAKINCYNPPTLRPYESIFSRLFRITTFHPAYLQNLKIFPQMTFFSEPENSVVLKRPILIFFIFDEHNNTCDQVSIPMPATFRGGIFA